MDGQNPMVNFFKNIRLPLHKGNNRVHDFLADLYKKYMEEIEILLAKKPLDAVFDQKIYADIALNRKLIEFQCNNIIDILRLHNSGYIADSYNKFNKLMNNVDKYLLTKKIVEGDYFYRIRPVDNKDTEIGRKDIFHVPFEENTKVKPYRYSIAGFPCLYLSSTRELCWLECGMPSRFYWSRFEADDLANSIEIINFKESPFPFLSNYYHYFINKEHLKYDGIIIDMVRYILTYPLMAACSLIVAKKNNSFIPEYIIPQMLLLWIHNNGRHRGIAYFSSTSNENARIINAYNIVLAPVSIAENGYCKQLAKEFKLINPIFFDTKERFGVLKNKVEELGVFRNNLYLSYVNKIGLHQIRELLSICDSFINLYWKTVSGEINDFQLIDQCLDTIVLYSYTFTGEMKKVRQQLIIEELNNNHVYKENKKIKQYCLNILDEYEKQHFDIIIAMWNMEFFIFLNTDNGNDDFDYIG